MVGDGQFCNDAPTFMDGPGAAETDAACRQKCTWLLWLPRNGGKRFCWNGMGLPWLCFHVLCWTPSSASNSPCPTACHRDTVVLDAPINGSLKLPRLVSCAPQTPVQCRHAAFGEHVFSTNANSVRFLCFVGLANDALTGGCRHRAPKHRHAERIGAAERRRGAGGGQTRQYGHGTVLSAWAWFRSLSPAKSPAWWYPRTCATRPRAWE